MTGVFVVALCCFFSMVFAVKPDPLYQLKVSDITVSGVSSGGFMAGQVHVAFSSVINGTAIFAAGPYYCAENNLVTAEDRCLHALGGGPNVDHLISKTRDFEKEGKIDVTTNMADDIVYIFRGTLDSVANEKVMRTIDPYYQAFVSDHNRIISKFDFPAEHCVPTLDYGNACDVLRSPFIGKCGYDAVGEAFQTLYNGSLKPRTAADTKKLVKFDQTPYFNGYKASLGDEGYWYVPANCKAGATCRMHISFHGCLQTLNNVGNEYALHSGFLEWAEANDIILVFPYAKQSITAPINPEGCWDWWGYTGSDYVWRTGLQMAFTRNVIKAITGR